LHAGCRHHRPSIGPRSNQLSIHIIGVIFRGDEPCRLRGDPAQTANLGPISRFQRCPEPPATRRRPLRGERDGSTVAWRGFSADRRTDGLDSRERRTGQKSGFSDFSFSGFPDENSQRVDDQQATLESTRRVVHLPIRRFRPTERPPLTLLPSQSTNIRDGWLILPRVHPSRGCPRSYRSTLFPRPSEHSHSLLSNDQRFESGFRAVAGHRSYRRKPSGKGMGRSGQRERRGTTWSRWRRRRARECKGAGMAFRGIRQ
jgi:hypothetical protein